MSRAKRPRLAIRYVGEQADRGGVGRCRKLSGHRDTCDVLCDRDDAAAGFWAGDGFSRVRF